MSRAISASALAGMLGAETDQVYLPCLTIDHDDLGTPIRLVAAMESITRTAGVFTAYGFQIDFPPDVENQIPIAQLTIDNVDRSLIPAVRSFASPPTVTLEVVTLAAPNAIEAGPIKMTVRNATYNAEQIRITLAYAFDVLNERFPRYLFTPSNSPGIF